eukprot:g21283.t1
MLDRDSSNEVTIERLKDQVANLFREVQVVRASNESLKVENAEAFDRAERAEDDLKQVRTALADGADANHREHHVHRSTGAHRGAHEFGPSRLKFRRRSSLVAESAKLFSGDW